MGKYTKEQLAGLSNQDFASYANLSKKEVDTAFSNFNKLVNYIGESNLDEEAMVRFFNEKTEVANAKDFGKELSIRSIYNGTLNSSISELAEIPNVNIKSIAHLVKGLQNLDLPEFEEDEETPPAEDIQRRTSAYEHFHPISSIQGMSTYGTALAMPLQGLIFSESIMNTIEEFSDELEKVTDAVESGADLVKAGKKLVKEFKDAKDLLSGKKKGSANNPRDEAGGVTSGEQTLEPTYGEIEDDEYYNLFGEALENEPAYTVWLDRLMAFEVDGAGDDNVFWTSEVTVLLKDPNKIIKTSFISKIYDIDELQEYRLRPGIPMHGKRAFPLDDDDWSNRGFLDDGDANFALRVKGETRGIPLSKLNKIKIKLYLYESDSVEELIDFVAELGSTAIAALAIIKGKFSAPAGSTAEVARALNRTLKKLNKLINSDDLILSARLRFTKSQILRAFKQGQTFKVDEGTTAAIGMGYQRVAEAVRETHNQKLDKGMLDRYLRRHKNKYRSADFLEDKFDSYYEMRFRFEREDPEN